uniref:C-type lectin domain-containing protein n=1 Tax=Sphenodon punctatus TaxID=8508 RepID=A0A8D0GMX1_SPHPU
MMKKPINQAGIWKDRDCDYEKSYICQRNTDLEFDHTPITIPVSGVTSYSDSSYFFIPSKATWEEARKKCKTENSELISILDPYTHSFLWLQVLEYGEPVWIGLNSNMTGGNYKWIDGWKVGFTKWGSGEPKENRACVYLDLDGDWKTGACNQSHLSVCKQSDVLPPTDPPQAPGRCPESKNSPSWIPFRGHCYYISLIMKDWPGASMRCNQLGATLVSIEDLIELKFLTRHLEQLESFRPGFWIGLFKNVDGEWIWVDDTAVDFVNWKKGEPVGESYHKDCAVLNSEEGEWFTSRSSSNREFICKKKKIPEAEPNVTSLEKKGRTIS